jgi:hypothetical protein
VKKKRKQVKTARGQVTLELSERQVATLVMLTLTGATAFDSSSPLAAGIRARLSQQFGVDISDADIVSVVSKIKSLVSRDEDVVIDDRE